ncbi:33660_t:CDS:2 [Racocetra persica]|uniref:33660_t:CDS:1 n=1 Tax=Racocetra persica TaxID=160502 RepID=A0ACA9KVT7_9GLOM|nr:33660_t:CDS:2 [Racocetra persica]
MSKKVIKPQYIYDGTIDLTDLDFSDIIFLLLGAHELRLKELCNYIETYVVSQKDLIKKHISLINRNRKTLANFTRLAVLWRKIIAQDVNIFSSNDFTTLQRDEFLHCYINRPKNVTDIELWEKLIKWSTVHSSSSLPSNVSQYNTEHFAILKKLIKPFIQYIKFKYISKTDFSQNIRPFRQAFDPDFYIQLLDTHAFDEFQESNTATKTPSPSNISTISAALTSDAKLPISVEINFESTRVSSTAITAVTTSKPTNTTEFKSTKSTSASATITSASTPTSSPTLTPTSTSTFSPTFTPTPTPTYIHASTSTSAPTSVVPSTRQLTIQSTLIEQKHIVLIVKWINEIYNLNPSTFYTFNLLQRASRHGSNSKKFHARCDNKGPTLVIIRIKDTGEIIGGYNPIDWCKATSKNTYHSASTSFIFSLNLQDPDDSIVSKVIDTEHAIRQNRYTGPGFGKNDLKICGETKENEKSRCRKGSYEKSIRQSSDIFSVDDFEVFQVFRKSTMQ